MQLFPAQDYRINPSMDMGGLVYAVIFRSFQTPYEFALLNFMYLKSIHQRDKFDLRHVIVMLP